MSIQLGLGLTVMVRRPAPARGVGVVMGRKSLYLIGLTTVIDWRLLNHALSIISRAVSLLSGSVIKIELSKSRAGRETCLGI